MTAPERPALFRFGPFEFDAKTRELRNSGLRVDVQDLPLRLLTTLLERPGELVTREELRRRLWPADTFVDFEHGLNAAVHRLRAAVGCSAARPVIETLPRRGYRIVVPVDAGAGRGGTAAVRHVTRLLVVPFRVLRPDADTDFLAFAVPDAVAGALVGLEGLVVRSAAAGMRFAGAPFNPRQIAGEAEVDAVLTGTIVRADTHTRVASQLLAVPEGSLIWSDTVDVRFEDLFQLQDTIVRRIVDSLPVPARTGERLILKTDIPSNPVVYELYLRANQLLATGISGGQRLTVARDLYERALERDANYAPAWARLGRCHWLIGKASERAPEHLALADDCFRRALAINPTLLLAHSYHAQLEADIGRALPAMVRLLTVAQSSPPIPELFAALVQVCRFCGQLEASIAADERARGLDPHVSTSANHTYWQLGDLDRAFAARASGTFALDTMILAKWGRQEEALALLREREASLPLTSRTYAEALRATIENNPERRVRAVSKALGLWPDPEGRYYLATYLGKFGEPDRALAELNRCLDDGFIHYRLLKGDPEIAILREHAAFQPLLARSAEKYRDACLAFTDAGGQRLFGL
jgi:DNA-binding winged helix-turn-helix (wHTH) protein/tetratricopeptide (TPR) repeat protein